MSERISFNINAELYENEFDQLAVELPGKKVFRNAGNAAGARFQSDVVGLLEQGEMPSGWQEMPAHELSGRNWRRIARLGYLGGDPNRPGVEFEKDWESLGKTAKNYLADAAPE